MAQNKLPMYNALLYRPMEREERINQNGLAPFMMLHPSDNGRDDIAPDLIINGEELFPSHLGTTLLVLPHETSRFTEAQQNQRLDEMAVGKLCLMILRLSGQQEDVLEAVVREEAAVPFLATSGLDSFIQLHLTSKPVKTKQGEETIRMVESVSLAREDVSLDQQFLTQYVEQGIQARNAIVENNQPLVVSTAKRCFEGKLEEYSMNMADCIQEGCIALQMATGKFDYRRGFAFSTYIGRWIQKIIQRSLDNEGRGIRISVHAMERFNQGARKREETAQLLARTLTPEEFSSIRSKNALPFEHERDVQIARWPRSLDVPVFISGENSPSLVEITVDTGALFEDPEESVCRKDMRAIVAVVLSSLPPKEERIVRRYFGISPDGIQSEPKAQSQIAEEEGYTRQGIHGIIRRALKKLGGNPAMQALKP